MPNLKLKSRIGETSAHSGAQSARAILTAVGAILVLSVLATSRATAQTTFWQRLFQRSDKKQNIPTVVAGVRGLDEPDDAGDRAARDYDALKKIEGFSVETVSVEKFISDGRLK
ncbi:MAG: hypothetical protein QME32_06770 [Endomicrobiia bacterium]|nr:hypothetical protein [Endomicrobiia bacterium]